MGQDIGSVRIARARVTRVRTTSGSEPLFRKWHKRGELNRLHGQHVCLGSEPDLSLTVVQKGL
jgi:hypothetical protein